MIGAGIGIGAAIWSGGSSVCSGSGTFQLAALETAGPCPSNSAPPSNGAAATTSDVNQLASQLTAATHGAGQRLIDTIRAEEAKIGLESGDGAITEAKIGVSNYQAIVSDIRAIGREFNGVSSLPSNDERKAVQAIQALAQQYQNPAPSVTPLSVAIACLLIAGALLLLPYIHIPPVPLFGPGKLFSSIDGVIPLLTPAMQSAVPGRKAGDARPLVSASDQKEIHDALASKGLSGDLLDGITRTLTLAASVAVADSYH
jgi:hypothetical protein